MLAVIKTGGKPHTTNPSGLSSGAGNPKNMSLAVIKTGGKQYLVSVGDKIKVEKLTAPETGKVVFDEVLLVEKNNKVELGGPFIKDVQVLAKVIKDGKAKKVIVFKYHSKTRYRKKRGHRQQFTEVEITKIT